MDISPTRMSCLLTLNNLLSGVGWLGKNGFTEAKMKWLADHGYVTLEPSPKGGVRVRLTESGKAAVEAYNVLLPKG